MVVVHGVDEFNLVAAQWDEIPKMYFEFTKALAY